MDPRLDERERALVARARAAAEKGVGTEAAAIDAEHRARRRLFDALGDAGLLSVCVSADRGGEGGGAVELALVAEELGRVSASVASVAVHHMVALLTIESAGSDAGEQDRVRRAAQGKRLIALAVDSGSVLEDPGVGATVSGRGDTMRLDGAMAGVAGATIADQLLLPAKSPERGVEWFFIDADAAGVRVDSEEPKLGLNGSGLATVHLQGADAGAEARVTVPDGAAMLSMVLDRARLGHAALCVGIAQAALEASTAHVTQAEGGLATSQSIQWMLADIATETDAARLLGWYAATRPEGEGFHAAAAMARLIASEVAVRATRRGLQVTGSAARAAGTERLYRDAKAMEIHHGAAEAQRLAIARSLLSDLFEDPSGWKGAGSAHP